VEGHHHQRLIDVSGERQRADEAARSLEERETMGRIGAMELGLILAVAVLLFGAGRIADIGKGLGDSIRQFKKGLREED
jgi:sec-independent protein translocase protein TatA